MPHGEVSATAAFHDAFRIKEFTKLWPYTSISSISLIKSNSLKVNIFPNPFNLTTRIQYTLGKNTKVEIAVYDLLGRKVATLMDGYQNGGSHQVVWDASEVSAGVYLYQMKTNDIVISKRMTLIK